MKPQLLFATTLALLVSEYGSVAHDLQGTVRPARTGRSEATYRGGLIAPALTKPKFVLTDTSGVPFDFWDRTRGSVTLLFFGYTHCPDQCPLHMATIGAALKKLGPDTAARITLVFVSTDPARDSTAALRRWLDQFDHRFIGLTGTERAVAEAELAAGIPAARKAGLQAGTYSVSHANMVIAYTMDNLAHVIYPGGVTEDDWEHDLPLLTRETWSQP